MFGVDDYLLIASIATPLVVIWLVATAYATTSRARESHQELKSEIRSLRAELDAIENRWKQMFDNMEAEYIGLMQDGADAASALGHNPKQTDRIDTLFEAAKSGVIRIWESPDVPGSGLRIRTLVRALNFAEDADDVEGFKAVETATRNSTAKLVLDASMTVLNSLARHDIIMDDLRPSIEKPNAWRKYSEPGVEKDITALGSIGKLDYLKLVSGLYGEEKEFRSQADRLTNAIESHIGGFVSLAADHEILAFADSRTLRAFLLVGLARRHFLGMAEIANSTQHYSASPRYWVD